MTVPETSVGGGAGPGQRSGSNRAWALRTLLLVIAWIGLMVGVGYLLGGPLAGPASGEDGLVGTLQDGGTATLDGLSAIGSRSADTAVIIGTAAAIGFLSRLLLGRWLESFLLWGGVALQTTMFLMTTLLVSRERPEYELMDPAPPTSSFPSGHTGAATALWLGVGMIAASRIERRRLRVAVVALLLLIPLAVGISRLYRGMHHPSDVVFGVLNGTVAVALARSALRGMPSGQGAGHP